MFVCPCTIIGDSEDFGLCSFSDFLSLLSAAASCGGDG